MGFNESRVGVWQDPGSWLVAANLPSKSWHHFAYTFDGQTHRLYVDGSQKSSSTIVPTAGASASLQIGRMIGGSNCLRGTVDELRIYSRALSQSDIQTLKTLITGSQP